MKVLRTLADIERQAAALGRASGLGGVFVPTMGALHAGHAALVEQAAALARERGSASGCVVSIFVNPTQFNESADFARYPRTLEADLAVCERAGARVVLVPEVETVYPPGDPGAAPVPPLPRVAREPGLEDAYRPGHFAGVCQVVLRLLRLVEPEAAVFGEKDWQQLCVVRAMVESLALGVEIVGGPTVREPDGLAMSSRNRFLSPEERAKARAISLALCEARRGGTPAEAERIMEEVLGGAGITPEYAAVRDAATLMPAARPGSAGPWRALIAARVGGTRLIDNSVWISAGSVPEQGGSGGELGRV